jgi:hypothetical protein
MTQKINAKNYKIYEAPDMYTIYVLDMETATTSLLVFNLNPTSTLHDMQANQPNDRNHFLNLLTLSRILIFSKMQNK